MADTAKVLAFQYPTAVPLVDYLVVNRSDGAGPVIQAGSWNTALLGPQPTPAQIATIEASPAYVTYWGAPAVAQRERDRSAAAVVSEKHNIYDGLRAAAAVLVDEINILRAFHSLPPRTLAQAKSAIQAKITSGEAD